jgi:hypothetical protein
MPAERPTVLASFASVRIPPEEAAAIAVLFVESSLVAWHHKRIGIAARMYRTRRQLTVAFESEGGVKSLLYGALAQRRAAAQARVGRRRKRALPRRG